MVLQDLAYIVLHPIKTLKLLYDCHLQNKALATLDTTAESLIVFVVSGKNRISGGTMSIYSLVTAAKNIKDVHGSEVILVTFPGFRTHFKNRYFISGERSLRFSQLRRFKNLKKIMIHLPEFLAGKFYAGLSLEEKDFFSTLPEFRVNILNQNIELMPDVAEIASLRQLTAHITQTTAHDKYSTQAVCDHYQLPLHHFSVFIDLSGYTRVPFAKKEKIIVLSPDKRDCREKIVHMLKKALPDYKVVTVRNLTFARFMSLVSKAKFSLTFGEGFDGYLIHPLAVGSLSFAVYNEQFFPDDSFMGLANIYATYEDLYDRLADDMRRLEADEREYGDIVSRNMEQINRLYSYEDFLLKQKRFYLKHYDYVPSA